MLYYADTVRQALENTEHPHATRRADFSDPPSGDVYAFFAVSRNPQSAKKKDSRILATKVRPENVTTKKRDTLKIPKNLHVTFR